MFLLILGVLALIAGIVFGCMCISEGYKGGAVGCFLGGVVLAVILVVCSCLSSVPTGHTGVVTTFGKVEDHVFDSGINFKAPWQSVIKMDNRVQKQTVELMSFSSDIQEVSIKYTVNYQIDKANAMTIYKTIGTTYYDTVIMPSIIEAVKEITALYTAENLINTREEVSSKIEVLLTDRLAKYNIQVVNSSIEDMDFSDVFTDAVEAKQVAQQNALKAEEDAKRMLVEANANAEQKKIQAQAEAEAAKISAEAEAYQIEIKAKAEAEANAKIIASLSPELIDYIYANGWDGKLPTYMAGEGSIPVFGMN
jgi:regulator of protease activity HflC (stomatin/prohibitin superfamily)